MHQKQGVYVENDPSLVEKLQVLNTQLLVIDGNSETALNDTARFKECAVIEQMILGMLPLGAVRRRMRIFIADFEAVQLHPHT